MTATLNIYPQRHAGGDCRIVGNTEALRALLKALNAMRDSDTLAMLSVEVFASDGEAYSVRLCRNEQADCLTTACEKAEIEADLRSENQMLRDECASKAVEVEDQARLNDELRTALAAAQFDLAIARGQLRARYDAESKDNLAKLMEGRS